MNHSPTHHRKLQNKGKKPNKKDAHSSTLSLNNKNNKKKPNNTRSSIPQIATGRVLRTQSGTGATGLHPRTVGNHHLLHKNTPKKEHQDTWGQALNSKRPNTIRMLVQNIGGIDIHKRGSVKMAALHEFMENQQVDLVAITECNAAWSKIDPELWPQEQTRFWWDSAHWSLTHNRQDPDAAVYQPGGTGLLVVNQLAHRAQRPGDDTAGLGRWCWARLRGKGNKYLRLISAYRPCPSAGPLSTYQQQVRYWSSKQDNSCPREKWLHDLQEEILRWHEVGDYVVLMADMNEDVNSETIQHFCQETNLVEIISELYRPSPLPTHQ